MKEKKLYKIRRNLDGLFAKGGSNPHAFFNDNGKIWRGLGPLRNHISLITENWEKYKQNGSKEPHPYEDCEVIEIEMVVINTIPAMEEILGSLERKKDKQKWRRDLH